MIRVAKYRERMVSVQFPVRDPVVPDVRVENDFCGAALARGFR